jgi:hypothetical protein
MDLHCKHPLGGLKISLRCGCQQNQGFFMLFFFEFDICIYLQRKMKKIALKPSGKPWEVEVLFDVKLFLSQFKSTGS